MDRWAFLFRVAHIEDEAGTTRRLVVIAPDLESAQELADEWVAGDHVVDAEYPRGFTAIGGQPTDTPWPTDSTE